MPENSGGFKAIKFAKFSEKMYQSGDGSPVNLPRYQVLHNYGPHQLISNGGPSSKDDLRAVARGHQQARGHW